MNSQNKILIVSAPSGGGKTTLVNKLCERGGYRRIVSLTTRAPRGKEVDGQDYFFVPETTFEEYVQAGKFLEFFGVYGNRYGTLMGAVEAAWKDRVIPILAIDVQGHAFVRQHFEVGGLVRSVFITLPLSVLAERLRDRGDTEEAVIQRRLKAAPREIGRMNEFDRVVMNDRPKQVVFDEFREVVEELLAT